MINFNNAEFIISSSSTSEHLYDFPQILMIGKSNVGKSSLINALTRRNNLAFVSKTPGHTTLINYYLIDKTFYLVDAPGFGYRKIAYSQDDFEVMMSRYLDNHPQLKLICYLIDSRRELKQDEKDTLNYLKSLNYQYVVLFTKVDKLNQKEKSRLLKDTKKNNIDRYLLISNTDEKLISNLRECIINYLK